MEFSFIRIFMLIFSPMVEPFQSPHPNKCVAKMCVCGCVCLEPVLKTCFRSDLARNVK